jgi:hypothetical protein
MMTAAKLAANRANALKSTGPRTNAGKRRSSHNARRHGLNKPLSPADRRIVAKFASMLAEPLPHLFPLASEVAAAQHTLQRVREARCDLLARAEAGELAPDHLWRIEALDRYERRARSRCKFAIFRFKAAVAFFSHLPPIVQNCQNEPTASSLPAEPGGGRPPT